MASIYEDVITKVTFFQHYMHQPQKMAFIMRPVVTHEQYYQAIFNEGLRKLFYYVRRHDCDPKTMATFAKIVEKAGDRIIGPVAQRIQMHQKQEVTHTAQVGARDVDPDDPKSLQDKINEMQQKLNASTQKQIDELKVIDVSEFE